MTPRPPFDIHRSEEISRELLDMLREGVVIVQDENIVFANASLGAMLGYAPDELFVAKVEVLFISDRRCPVC
ncbi:PAS domain-containing protein [bacterium]|nr:PAS domain-containing protein [bacterium]